MSVIMLEEHVKALISAAVDGELSNGQRADLKAHLEDSEEARRYHASLKRLDDVLARAPQVPLPDQLHERIISQIKIDKPQARGFGISRLPGFMRYGLAAAAGLVIAVGIYELGPPGHGPADHDSLVGTMVPSPTAAGEVVDAFSFELDSLTSNVNLLRRDGALVLKVEFDAEQPIDLDVSVAGGGLFFDALAQSTGNFDSFDFADQLIHARGQGRQEFIVLLGRASGAADRMEAAIRLRYRGHWGLIEERVIAAEL